MPDYRNEVQLFGINYDGALNDDNEDDQDDDQRNEGMPERTDMTSEENNIRVPVPQFDRKIDELDVDVLKVRTQECLEDMFKSIRLQLPFVSSSTAVDELEYKGTTLQIQVVVTSDESEFMNLKK